MKKIWKWFIKQVCVSMMIYNLVFKGVKDSKELINDKT